MIPRGLDQSLRVALADRPVVVLQGPRQSGKTTLARALTGRRYLTLDEASLLASARADPAGFLALHAGPIVIDEIQMAPDLLPAVKLAVDRDRRPGRFLLTGSANALVVPGLARSLVGRMEALTLWPLAQAELAGRGTNPLDAWLAPRFAPGSRGRADRPGLARRMATGGYPEAVALAPARRGSWYESYVGTILQRDVRELADIEGLTLLPRLLGVVAARATGLLNFADLSRTAGIPQSTLKRYLALLEATFLVQMLPAWARSSKIRLIRAPKVVMGDTGLLCHLGAASERRLLEDPVLFGRVLENFVGMEVRKLAGWARLQPRLSHYRDVGGREVDLVLETPDGDAVGVEVKGADTVGPHDFAGLKAFADAAGPRFLRGLLLYGGAEPAAFGPGFFALPVSDLWA
ncbi:MAG: ATP-binding protein [Candidatus Coatesbacteria bacterium]